MKYVHGDKLRSKKKEAKRHGWEPCPLFCRALLHAEASDVLESRVVT